MVARWASGLTPAMVCTAGLAAAGDADGLATTDGFAAADGLLTGAGGEPTVAVGTGGPGGAAVLHPESTRISSSNSPRITALVCMAALRVRTAPMTALPIFAVTGWIEIQARECRCQCLFASASTA